MFDIVTTSYYCCSYVRTYMDTNVSVRTNTPTAYQAYKIELGICICIVDQQVKESYIYDFCSQSARSNGKQ